MIMCGGRYKEQTASFYVAIIVWIVLQLTVSGRAIRRHCLTAAVCDAMRPTTKTPEWKIVKVVEVRLMWS